MENLLDLDYDWHHNKIIYASPQKLYHLALVKETLSLYYEESDELWECKEIFSRVQEKITLTLAPKKIKYAMALMAEIIWTQLHKLSTFLYYQFSINKRQTQLTFLKNNTHWTSQGTIDHRKTAKNLAEDPDLDVPSRLEIAVRYCLEDQINALYNQAPPDYFNENVPFLYRISCIDNIPLARHYFNVRDVGIDYKHCFQLQTTDEYCCSIGYYWQRLSEQEKSEILETQYSSIEHFWSEGKDRGSPTLFLLTQCPEEKKLQLLQNESWVYNLLKELLEVEWFPFFFACIKDGLTRLTADHVAKLLNKCMKRIKPRRPYKKQYTEIYTLLLEHLCSEFPSISLHPCSDSMLMKASHILSKAGEIQLTKDFFQSVCKEWIKKQFSADRSDLKFLIMSSLNCGMLDLVFNCAFSTIENRKVFYSRWRVIKEVTHFLFLENQRANIDTLFSLASLDSEEIKSYKIKFAEENGCRLCFDLFSEGKYEHIDKFVQWCFTPEEAAIHSFKTKFTEEYACQLCFKFLMDNKYESVDKLFQWCFRSDEKAIHSFKMKFAEKSGSELCFQFFMKKKCSSVDKFAHWCFGSEEKAICSFKKKFAEETGCKLCFELFECIGRWEGVDNFVQCCFASEEEIVYFYNQFFRSDHFTSLFNPVNEPPRYTFLQEFEKQFKAIISYIKVINLRNQFGSNELMLDVCLPIISQCYICYYCNIVWTDADSKFFFAAIDRFLLAFIEDDQKMLVDLRKDLFADKCRKLYFSLPLEFHKQVQVTHRTFNGDWEIEEELQLPLWLQMVNEFIAWICSSDEQLKGELEEEVWSSKEILEAEEHLRSKLPLDND